MSRNYRSISRVNSSYAHIADETGHPVCGRHYQHTPDFFRTVDKDATCQGCIRRHEGLAARANETAEAVDPAQARYRLVTALVDNYVRLTTPTTEGLNPAELNVLRHKVNGAAVTALDAILNTDLYAEMRRRAGLD
jgi:hypothetical protein